MTVQPLPQSPPIVARTASEMIAVYNARESAYLAALRAVRASRYPLDVRVRFLCLLDKRLAASCSAAGVARETILYTRVAAWFARRAR